MSRPDILVQSHDLSVELSVISTSLIAYHLILNMPWGTLTGAVRIVSDAESLLAFDEIDRLELTTFTLC